MTDCDNVVTFYYFLPPPLPPPLAQLCNKNILKNTHLIEMIFWIISKFTFNIHGLKCLNVSHYFFLMYASVLGGVLS